ncbi:glutamate receptor ionotropic, delta-2-like [Pieris napi]|uniref:glutamate receptor ionotropic, delta-2-like n=1 Tax=Pieris napi TaxID=78633 RepID=UPI001FB9016F|nr:glutamate receptor ionotropic, delta-2-like [Pieris napi]
MAGLELILSTVCNATFCGSINDNPLHDVKPVRHQLENFVNGMHLRIGTYNYHPDNWVEKTENGTYYIGRGVAFDLVHILQKKFNFTYEVVVPENNMLFSDDRPVESLIGLLQSKRIDLAAAFIPIMKNSDQFVSFSTVIDECKWMMMLKRPKESAVGSGLLAPFNETVWLLILAAVMIYGPCLTLLTKLRSKLMPEEEDYIRLSPSFWFVYGAFIKQGTSLTPSANTTRVLFATWWLFIILLSAFYTANLTAFLTLSKFTLDIETVQDLYTKNYRWVAPEGGPVEYAIKNPDEDIHFLLKTVATGQGSFLSVRDTSSLLTYVSEGAVLVHPSAALEYIMYHDYLQKTRLGVPEAERCTYVVAPGVFMTKKRAIKRVKYSGILSHLSQRYLPDTKICPLDLKSKDRQLRNTDLLMTYYILMTGLAAAVAVFLAEISLKRFILPKSDAIRPRFCQQREIKIEPAIFDDSRPPPYECLFGKTKGESKKKFINGREYWVIKKENGETRLIPVRSLSALLYR